MNLLESSSNVSMIGLGNPELPIEVEGAADTDVNIILIPKFNLRLIKISV